MKIYKDLISPKAKEAVREGTISQHIVCGVDVYKIHEDTADSIHLKRKYKLIDILGEECFLFTDIPEARSYMWKNGVGVFNRLKKEILEADGEGITYVLTPLTKQEFREIMDFGFD